LYDFIAEMIVPCVRPTVSATPASFIPQVGPRGGNDGGDTALSLFTEIEHPLSVEANKGPCGLNARDPLAPRVYAGDLTVSAGRKYEYFAKRLCRT
jgi:hypothetical protein